jgi:hypothetical protein
MPNYIKYNSTSTDPGSLFKDQVALGVNTSSIVGPTSTTGWYSGITPTTKFIIYQTFDPVTGLDPDIFTPQSDQELFQLVKMKGGLERDYASVSASLAFFGSQGGYLATNFEYENIVTDGLVFHADAGFVGSLPQTGSKWYDLSGKNNNGAFTSGTGNIFPTWTSADSGSLSFTGTTNPSRIVCGNSSSLQISTGSISAWVKLPNNPTASIRGIIVKQQAWGLFVDQNYLVAYDWTGPQQINTNSIIGNNTWCYITLTFDGIVNGGGNIYLNAVNVNPFDFNIYVNSQDVSLVLGTGANSNAQPLVGNIAIASVYNRILSPAEIEQNYNAQRVRFGV